MSSNGYGEYTSLEDLQFKLEKHRDDGAAVSLETLKLLEESHHVKAALESYDGISQLSDYVDIVELGRRRPPSSTNGRREVDGRARYKSAGVSSYRRCRSGGDGGRGRVSARSSAGAALEAPPRGGVDKEAQEG